MTFYPVLRDAADRAFLFHVEAEGQSLKAAMLVAEPYMNSAWLAMSPEPGLGAEVLDVQMPAEIIGQPERYKGYDLNLPYRAKS